MSSTVKPVTTPAIVPAWLLPVPAASWPSEEAGLPLLASVLDVVAVVAVAVVVVVVAAAVVVALVDLAVGALVAQEDQVATMRNLTDMADLDHMEVPLIALGQNVGLIALAEEVMMVDQVLKVLSAWCMD